MFAVMLCFEISRRAVWARPVFGIKGGFSEIEKLFPYNMTEDSSAKLIFSVIFHIITLMMIIGLWAFLVGAGILGEVI